MSTTTEKQIMPGALQKPKVSIQKRFVLDLKPPYFKPVDGLNEDTPEEDLRYFLLYVSERAQEISVPATRRLYRRIEGGVPRKGRPHPAMHKKIRQRYLIGFEKDANGVEIATHIDAFPENRGYGSTLPEGAKDKIEVVMVINPATGEITVSDSPYGLRDTDFRRLIKAVDVEEQLYAGQLIGGDRYEVTNVVGNRVTISVLQDLARTSEGQSEYM
jgi:hypothetical protein